MSKQAALRQYPTPPEIAEIMISCCSGGEPASIFDPAVGTGEILKAAYERYGDKPRMIGWDIDDGILKTAQLNVPHAALEAKSIIHELPAGKAQLVIGEYPYGYYDNEEYKEKYSDVITGRPNLVCGFMKSAFKTVHPEGVMTVLVPAAVTAGSMFNKLRSYFMDINAAVVHVHDLLDIRPAMQIITLKPKTEITNAADSCTLLAYNHYWLWTTPEKMQKLTDHIGDNLTLDEVGYFVASGPFLWNRDKSRLRLRPGPGIAKILWPQMVKQGKYTNKPAYATIGDEQLLQGPAIVTRRNLNRGQKIPFMYVEEGQTFLAENHVLVIRPTDKSKISPRELFQLLQNVDNEQVNIIAPNNQLSATQLEILLGVVPR